MQLGIDHFFTKGQHRALQGRRLAVLCHHASRGADGRHLLDRLAEEGIRPALVLAPEHGIWGVAQDMEAVDTARDPLLGVEVHSLYGAEEGTLRLDPERLASFDTLLVDLQDVGSRYYTYATSLLYLLEQLDGRDVPVIVLDRPNPLGGLTLEGNLLHQRFRSFVGWARVPNRHGLTVGELARLHARQAGLDVSIQVVLAEGWRRQLPDPGELGLFYPSPNMPHVETALLYPGLCLLEGTNLSEGRGTTRPFHLVGAPFMDARAWQARLAAYELEGVSALPFRFRPMFGKWAGQICDGLYLQVTDPGRLRAYLLGLCLLSTAMEIAPGDFAWREEAYEFVQDRLAIDLLLGDDRVREALEGGRDPRRVVRALEPELKAFWNDRQVDLLYEP